MSTRTSMRQFEQGFMKRATEDVWKEFGDFGSQLAPTSVQILPLDLKCPPIGWKHEMSGLNPLIETCANMEFDKVMKLFCELILEMNRLTRAGDTFICDLRSYELVQEDGNEWTAISKLIPLLSKIVSFNSRVEIVLFNVFMQLSNLYTTYPASSKSALEVDNIRLDQVLTTICSLLSSVIRLEQTLDESIKLKSHFISWKRMIEVALNEQVSSLKQMLLLVSLANKIQIDLIDLEIGDTFKRIIHSCVISIPSEKGRKKLYDQFQFYLRNRFNDEGFITPDSWIGLCGFFVCYTWIFKRDEKRMTKTAISLQRKLPQLVGCGDEFLLRHLPPGYVDTKSVTSFRDAKRTFPGSYFPRLMMQQIVLTFRGRYLEVTNRIHLYLQTDLSKLSAPKVLYNIQTTLEQAIQLAQEMAIFSNSFLSLSSAHDKQVKKADLQHILSLIVMIHKIQDGIFHKYQDRVLQIVGFIVQLHSLVALKCLTKTKTRLVSAVGKYSEKKLDSISAVILASTCFSCNILSQNRMVLTSLCLSFIRPSLDSPETDQSILSYLMVRSLYINIMKDYGSWVQMPFLIFNWETLLSMSFNEPSVEKPFVTNMECIHSVLKSLDNELDSFTGHFVSSSKKDFTKKVHNILDLNLKKIAIEIESELRLLTYKNLQGEDLSPYKRKVKDFAQFLKDQSISFQDRTFKPRDLITSELSRMFYNMTSICLNDWNTYESLMNQMRMQHGMDFVTMQLPCKKTDQGMDILEITRKLESFVSRFSYNLNNQIFVEKSSDGKQLDVLKIETVSQSIQTHGFGMVNTSVNQVYQFLKKKLSTFNKFLFEERVRGKLIQDRRHFKESSSDMFPYERADKMVKGIRKLGLTSDGLSYLDRFRILITEMGNALGFVRMLRTGSLHLSSDWSSFVPDELGDLPNFSFLCTKEGMDPATHGAAQNLDSLLNLCSNNLSSDYFKILVDTFKDPLRDPTHVHLKNFYLIIPALTVSFVEAITLSKEKMTRKRETGASFTDDGLSIGIAYLLHLLDQTTQYEALHWMNSVQADITSQIRKTSQDESGDKLVQSRTLTIKRLENMLKEHQLFYYNLLSSRILFHH